MLEVRITVLTLLIFFLKSSIGFSQSAIEKYVKENTSEVKSVNPDSLDFTDLESIGNAIGNSKIVMLGEQDHGDATTFEAKTRLIKYLHEKKGFNILAFESDFFALNEGWEHLEKTQSSIDSFLKSNIFPIWTYCDACNNLFYHYIPETFQKGNPLNVSGFDSQLLFVYTLNNLLYLLDSVAKSLDISGNIFETTTQIINLLYFTENNRKENSDEVNNFTKKTLSPEAFNKRDELMISLKEKMLKQLPSNDFWIHVVENLRMYNQQYNYEINKVKEINAGQKDYWNTRDNQMALNLKWLSEIKYPNEKIIVWAHNGHVAKYGNMKKKFYEQFHTMGSEFTSDSLLENKTYVLGFTSLRGTAGRINQKQYQIPKPKKSCFEKWINESTNYAFIDFGNYNSSNKSNLEEFYMAGSIYSKHEWNEAHWTEIFDGVFYIRDMTACNFSRPK